MITKIRKEKNMRNISKTAAVSLGALLVSVPAFAQTTGNGDLSFIGMMAIGAAIAIGLAAFGAASGQGKAAAAALDGIARNPSASGSMFLPLVLSLVFMEALGILAFLVGNGLVSSLVEVLKKVFGLA